MIQQRLAEVAAALTVLVVTAVSVFMRAEIAVMVVKAWSGRGSSGGRGRSSSGGRRGSTRNRSMSGDCAVTVTVAAVVAAHVVFVSVVVKAVVMTRS